MPGTTRSAPPPNWGAAVEQARRIVRASVAEQNLPGLSVAVGVGGDIVWAEGFGWADIEKQVPVAPETRFRIGTASTVLTSAAVGLLLEEGRLKLDDEIQAYVPAFPKSPWPVTLRQVMGHVAGLRATAAMKGRCSRSTANGRSMDCRSSRTRPLRFEPGTRFRNSRYGWIVVSAAIEAAAHEPFLRFMGEQIFEPLGMHDTRPDSATEPVSGPGERLFPEVRGESPLWSGSDAGARLLLLRRLQRVRVHPGRPGPLRHRHRARHADAAGHGTPAADVAAAAVGTGDRLRPGWEVATVALAGKDTRMVGHGGDSLGGTVASLMTFPEHGIIVAVISNISYANTSAVGSQRRAGVRGSRHERGAAGKGGFRMRSWNGRHRAG